jgi:hypothetical protein
MKKLQLITPERSFPGAAGSLTKSSSSKSEKIPKKNIRFPVRPKDQWEQPLQLSLDNNLRAAIPLWIARIHADFAAFGGLPVIDKDVLWFNAWSVTNLLEWTDASTFGELEPLRLRRLAVEAIEKRLEKIRSAEKKAELARAIRDLTKVRVGRYSSEKFVSREETVRRQIESGIELIL